MSDLLPVIQADRDAVQAFHRTMLDRLMADVKSKRPKLGEDEGDAGTLVQAFARHRLATTPGGGLLEQAAREKALEERGAELTIAYHVAICSPKGVVPDNRFYDPVLATTIQAALDASIPVRSALSPARDGAGS